MQNLSNNKRQPSGKDLILSTLCKIPASDPFWMELDAMIKYKIENPFVWNDLRYSHVMESMNSFQSSEGMIFVKPSTQSSHDITGAKKVETMVKPKEFEVDTECILETPEKKMSKKKKIVNSVEIGNEFEDIFFDMFTKPAGRSFVFDTTHASSETIKAHVEKKWCVKNVLSPKSIKEIQAFHPNTLYRMPKNHPGFDSLLFDDSTKTLIYIQTSTSDFSAHEAQCPRIIGKTAIDSPNAKHGKSAREHMKEFLSTTFKIKILKEEYFYFSPVWRNLYRTSTARFASDMDYYFVCSRSLLSFFKETAPEKLKLFRSTVFEEMDRFDKQRNEKNEE